MKEFLAGDQQRATTDIEAVGGEVVSIALDADAETARITVDVDDAIDFSNRLAVTRTGEMIVG